MANHRSSKKRIRRNAKRAAINTSRRSRLRTFIKNVETAVLAGDAQAAKSALSLAQPEIDRCVAKGILHRRTASRKLSRLSAKIKAIQL